MRPNDPLFGHYLAHSLVMRLATVSAHGGPSLTPIWFVTVDGRLVSSTAATTVAARNVAAEPRVTVLLDGERAGRSEFVVRLRGTAEVHRGLPPLGVLARFGLKYYLSPGGCAASSPMPTAGGSGRGTTRSPLPSGSRLSLWPRS